ncbi:hypothetical protein ACLB2K_022002 [Fragaria x ananassa]
MVKSVWSSFNVYGCPQFILQQKLKLLKPILKDWNHNTFGNVNLAVDLARAKLEMIQLDISTNGFTEAQYKQEVEAHNALAGALLVQDQFWFTKAREKWVYDGDRNTGLVSKLIPSLVSVEDNDILTVIPSFEEIKLVVFSMDPDSAPDPDGYNGHFYRACWGFISPEVVTVVQSFFQTGYILPNLNCSHVALIPKVPEADTISQFRSIAMANFIFKIITRILADRLSPIASRIILPNQFDFLKGRQISDCILLTSECVNLMENSCVDGNIAIKLDVAKAFDTLNWSFLERTLNAFGFHATFVQWVSTILASAKLSILFNGSLVGFFNCSRGVRQGDPLFPLLFCLAEEVLSRGIANLVSFGKLQTISSPRGMKAPSHVLYADDIMIFCKGKKEGLLNLLSFIEEYGLNSGQLVNKEKS